MTPEQIRALLDGLSDLSDEDLASRLAEMEALTDEITQANDTARLAEMEAAVEVIEAARTVESERATAQADAEQRLADLASRAAAPVVEEVETADEETAEVEEVAEVEETTDAPAEPLAVAASANVTPIRTRVDAAAVARNQGGARAQAPVEQSPAPRRVITAAVNESQAGVIRGDEITSEQVWQMVERKARHFIRHPDPQAEDIYVASVTRPDLPEERQIHQRDDGGNAEKMEALVAAAKVQSRADIDEMSRTGKLPGMGGQALTAAVAALCAPLTPIYTIVEHASDATPFLDSLPSMGAERGGYTFSRSPGMSALTTGYTHSTATQAAEPVTKNIVEPACPSFVSVEVEANVLRIRHRNWSDKFWPERTRNLDSLGMAEKARNIEENLLTTLIASTGVFNHSAGDDYGAFRDFFNHLERAVVNIRHALRLSDSEPLEFHGQRSLVNTLRDDLMQGTDNPALLSQADAEIARHFAARGVRPYFHFDGPTEPLISIDGAALPDLPATFQWGLWVPGDVVALDAGELNVGVGPIRDATLNATNAFEMFFESFENVMVLGNHVLWVTSALCSNGTKAALTTAKACPSGS